MMMIKDKHNFVAGLLFAAFGTATAIGAMQYTMGTASRMGPGYFPFMLGIVLIPVGLILAASALGRSAEVTHLTGWSLRSVGLVLGSVVLFGVVVQHVGLIIASAGMILLSGFAHPEPSLRSSLISAAVLVPGTAIVFVWLLGLRIPLLPTFL